MTKTAFLAGVLQSDGTHILPIRVYHEDTDFSGFVYHASYVRFCERGRSEFVRALGLSQTKISESVEPAFFAVRRMKIEFLKPARYDDILEVHTYMKEKRGASLILQQDVFRGKEKFFTAEVQVALVSKDNRPLRLSQIFK
jgi:acyl-CoA thioester hydrolase